MAAKKRPAESSPQHVVLEIKVNQDAGYKSIDKRTDSVWEQRLERDFVSARGRQKFAQSAIHGAAYNLAQDPSASSQLPSDITDILLQTREWYEKTEFILEVIKAKRGFFNHGFNVKPEDEDIDEAKDKAFQKWYRDHAERIRRFVKETWIDVLVMDNAVSIWRENEKRNRRIITVPPERCKYSDALGVERLQVKFDWTEQDLGLTRGSPRKPVFGISNENLARYAKAGYIEMLPERGERFRVYKESRVGWGFAKPALWSLFHTFAQHESLEVADRIWAFVCRLAERWHIVGHEIKQGPRAGLPIHFLTKERGDEITKAYAGVIGGFMERVANFDHRVEFPFPSPDRFDKDKYASIWERMAFWAGPVGHYLHGLHTGKGSMPFLMGAIQEEAEDARIAISDYIVGVITEVFTPPVPIKAAWSNRIFQDPRQMLEAIKFLVASGALSLATALLEYGFSPKEERERKQEEDDLAKDPKTRGQVTPIYDPAHGPVEDAGASGGRPAGQRDANPRVELNGAGD